MNLQIMSPQGASYPVRAQRPELQDLNQNGILEDSELLHALDSTGDLREGADVGQLLKEYKAALTGVRESAGLESVQGYHTYAQVGDALQELAEKFPGQAERVSLGQSAEGREIWALRVGNQNADNSKPGVVITGCTHAREWMTVEVPIHSAKFLLENAESDPDCKRRLENTVTWFVPLVSPDGYEYSREKDGWWRKNRSVHENGPCPDKPGGIGVDPNRNYWDGKAEHFELYRPKGDTPCSTWDDFGQTSDNPRKDTYRGPSGGSEKEVQALLGLELNPANNIKGVLDYHSYGEMILIPYGSKSLDAERRSEYMDMGQKMNEKLGNRYDLKASSSLYPTSGGSNDIHEANGIFGMTMEIGRSFQPNASQIPAMTNELTPVNMVFIDEVAKRHQSS